MTKNYEFQNKELFYKIKLISNPARFKIIELTQDKELNVTQIGKHIKINYRRCSEYIRKLEKLNMIGKIRSGKETKVKSKVKIYKNKIEFLIL